MDRTRRLLAAIALLALLTAACGGAAKPGWTWPPDAAAQGVDQDAGSTPGAGEPASAVLGTL